MTKKDPSIMELNKALKKFLGPQKVSVSTHPCGCSIQSKGSWPSKMIVCKKHWADSKTIVDYPKQERWKPSSKKAGMTSFHGIQVVVSKPFKKSTRIAKAL